MLQRLLSVCVLMVGICSTNHVFAQPDGVSKISFNRDVRPILSDKCFHCHGPDQHTRESDLRFDEKESAFQDLGGYAAIVPGDSESSEMMVRILEEDEDLVMPPHESGKSLTKEEIDILTRWIDEGANWSAFWAYEAPVKHLYPLASNGEDRNWIDVMVDSRLHEHGLKRSEPADKVTLIRRVYFDLIGLPPTPEALDRFLKDDSVNSYEKVVDELLASQHFGERMAVYWLDLVRYADTVGYHGDQDHNISPYRDWVINAFNANMPFDQFTREQLAGDLLPNPTREQKIATGYNRLLQTSHEGGIQPKEYTAIYAADRVRNVSGVWMGGTMGCAQCHDHKYDPYTVKDFYSLAAFFADVDDEAHFKVGTNALPTARPPEMLILKPEDEKEWEKAKADLKSLQRKLELLRSSEQQKEKSGPIATDGDKDINDDVKKLESQIKAQQKKIKQIESRGARTMYTRALKTPRTVRILPRGNWMDESGDIVQPAIPEFLGTLEFDRRANRLDLANWLVDAKQTSGKLTARVFANRIWYLAMGVGISKSLDDFGGQGEPPAYPELLDNLAMEFIEHDWDVKHLIRLIVTSETYRQSSKVSAELFERDPYNQLFARQSRYRLPAEIVRDNALAISGLLNIDEIGGKSVKPYQPAGYYQHLNFPPRKYKHHKDARQFRRGVYVHWQRQFLHPTLKALDAPTREECTALRARSNTPLAALALLNDPSFVEAAKSFAHRILSQSEPNATFEQRLDLAFKLAVSRSPRADEAKLLKSYYETNLAEYTKDPETAKKLLAAGQTTLPEDQPLPELAAWASIGRVLLNLNETITRN